MAVRSRGRPLRFPSPKNLTPHASGLAGWSFEDFDKRLVQGVNKRGTNIEKLMPIEAFGQMNDLEKRALWEYLQTLPPMPFGNR